MNGLGITNGGLDGSVLSFPVSLHVYDLGTLVPSSGEWGDIYGHIMHDKHSVRPWWQLSLRLLFLENVSESIWYSTVIVYGREYAYSYSGIECCRPVSEPLFCLPRHCFLYIHISTQGGTVLGEPNRVESIGETEIPYSIFFDFVLTLGENNYR